MQSILQPPQAPHQHGGQLLAASHKYQIPLSQWLDLSTGISPFVYPLPNVPITCWQRLPEINDGLEQAASSYYGSANLLAVSGSQEAIQCLPLIFPKKQKVGILEPAYHSHQQAWAEQGHNVITLTTEQVESQLDCLDILLVVNPRNPSAETLSTQRLEKWHQILQQNNSTLLVDEAFMDATPEQSLICNTPKQGLIVLRSIGKFFGLAGIRLGFVWAEESILQALAKHQDDWSVSHPARWAGKLALQDTHWHAQQRKRLPELAIRLVALLEKYIFTRSLETGGVYFNTTNQHVHHTALFAYFQHPRAKIIHKQIAQQGILTRLFNEESPALRFGLPKDEQQFKRLEKVLEGCTG